MINTTDLFLHAFQPAALAVSLIQSDYATGRLLFTRA